MIPSGVLSKKSHLAVGCVFDSKGHWKAYRRPTVERIRFEEVLLDGSEFCLIVTGKILYGKATQTAIAALSRLAEMYDGGKTRLSATEIAETRGLQRPFLAKILYIPVFPMLLQ